MNTYHTRFVVCGGVTPKCVAAGGCSAPTNGAEVVARRLEELSACSSPTSLSALHSRKMVGTHMSKLHCTNKKCRNVK
jgi:hypothetical protein